MIQAVIMALAHRLQFIAYSIRAGVQIASSSLQIPSLSRSHEAHVNSPKKPDSAQEHDSFLHRYEREVDNRSQGPDLVRCKNDWKSLLC